MIASALLEREAERAALASAVERVAAGDGGDLVMVLGEAGIGKTALLAVAGELARASGIRTFRAAGAPLEHDFGYGVVRQLLEGELRSPRERARNHADVLRRAIAAARGAARRAPDVLGRPAEDLAGPEGHARGHAG